MNSGLTHAGDATTWGLARPPSGDADVDYVDHMLIQLEDYEA